MYRVFDLLIDCELALPWLTACEEGRADWSVQRGAAGEGYQRFHAWNAPDGSALMRAGRRGDAYLLEFPGSARFGLDFAARVVTVESGPGTDDATVAHLLLDQVLPRAVCHEGRCVLHASAIRMGQGAVAFAGTTGSGKSTLAAAFHRQGFPVVGDDCLLVEPRRSGTAALAAYPSLRLWPDSADALYSIEQQARWNAGPMAGYSDKRVLGVPAEPSGPDRLLALCLLGPEDPSAGRGAVRLEPVRGVAAVMPLIEAQFALDVVGRKAVIRSFEAVRRVAGRVPVYRLSYPRDFDSLSRVIKEVTRVDFSSGGEVATSLPDGGGMRV